MQNNASNKINIPKGNGNAMNANNGNVKLNNNGNAMNANNVKLNNNGNVNNVKKPVETLSALSVCSTILWGIPVIVGIVQIIMWLIKLYKIHILKEKTEEESLKEKINQIHSLLSQNKKLNSKNKQLESEVSKLKKAPLIIKPKPR